MVSFMSSPYACLILHVWIARLGGELEFLAAEDSCDVLYDDKESAEDVRMDKRETHDISKVGVNDGLNDTSNDGNGVKGAFGKVPVFGSWMVVQKNSMFGCRLTCTSSWECTILCINRGPRGNVW